MEIKNNMNRLDPYLNRLQAEKDEAGAGVGKTTAAPAGDTVQIKSPGLKAAIEESAMNAPDIRESKVATLKASLANGTYKIDNSSIAAKLLQEANELY